jgi:hypothetical protein
MEGPMFSRDDLERPLRWPLMWVIGPLVIGALLVSLVGIGIRASQGFPDIELADELQQLAATDDPLLAETTEFDWDRVCIFRSNLPKEDVDRTLGFEWGVIGGDTIDNRDLVVFLNDGQVVKHFYLGREVLRGPARDGECHLPDDEATRL